jgi:predicted RNase H-like HicB family nuclease
LIEEVENMLLEYIQEALERAQYELIKDEEPYYGEVSELPGVWATGKSLEECRRNLREVVEGWIVVRLQRGLSLPPLGKKRLGKVKELMVRV